MALRETLTAVVILLAGCAASGDDRSGQRADFALQVGNTSATAADFTVELIDSEGEAAVTRQYTLPGNTKTPLEPLDLPAATYRVHATSGSLTLDRALEVQEPLQSIHIMLRNGTLELLTANAAT